MSEQEGSIEYNFRAGVVTHIEEDRAQFLVLHSRQLHDFYKDEPYDSYDFGRAYQEYERRALDTDLESDFLYIDLLGREMDYAFRVPQPWTGGGEAKMLRAEEVPDLWGDLKTGSFLHLHDFRDYTPTALLEPGVSWQYHDRTEYCLRPRTLSNAGIFNAIAQAKALGDERIRQKITELEETEKELTANLEVVDAGFIRLFEGASVAVGERTGLEYLEIPTRVVTSSKYGTQLLEVRTRPVPTIDRDRTGKMYFSRVDDDTCGEYWIPANFPLEEVDEHGTPVDVNKKWVSVDISVHNPMRQHGYGMEEEKLVFEVMGKKFWAKPDTDMLAGNQGFGGLDYVHFLDTADDDPYYERTEGLSKLPIEYRSSQMIVAIDDLEALMELWIHLPGFE